MTSDERPPARPRPRPASDSGSDPVDLTSAPATRPAAPATAAPATNPEAGDPMAGLTPTTAEGSYQLGVRVSEEYYDLVERIKSETGASKRKIIENALAYTYANYMNQGN